MLTNLASMDEIKLYESSESSDATRIPNCKSITLLDAVFRKEVSVP